MECLQPSGPLGRGKENHHVRIPRLRVATATLRVKCHARILMVMWDFYRWREIVAWPLTTQPK